MLPLGNIASNGDEIKPIIPDREQMVPLGSKQETCSRSGMPRADTGNQLAEQPAGHAREFAGRDIFEFAGLVVGVTNAVFMPPITLKWKWRSKAQEDWRSRKRDWNSTGE